MKYEEYLEDHGDKYFVGNDVCLQTQKREYKGSILDFQGKCSVRICTGNQPRYGLHQGNVFVIPFKDIMNIQLQK